MKLAFIVVASLALVASAIADALPPPPPPCEPPVENAPGGGPPLPEPCQPPTR